MYAIMLHKIHFKYAIQTFKPEKMVIRDLNKLCNVYRVYSIPYIELNLCSL